MAENVGGIVWTAEMQTAQLVSAEKQISSSLAKTESSFVAAGKSAQVMNTQVSKAATGVTAALGGVGRSAGQAGIQMQQFVGQLQGGVSPMVALSQQAADLGFVLGVPLLGAIVSISAAIGGMLFASLNKTAAEIKDQFLPNIEDLRENLDQISKAQASIAILQIREELEPLSGIARNAASQVEYLTKQIEKYPSNKDVQAWNKELFTQQSILDGVNQRIIKLNEDQTAFQAVIKRNIEGTQGQQEADKRRIETISDLISATEAQAKTAGLTQRGIALYVAEQAKASEADLKRINAAYDVIEAEERLAGASKAGIKEDKSKAKALESVVSGLDEQYKKLTMTTDAYEEYSAVQQAEAANATPAQIAAIREKVKALQSERAAIQANADLQAEIAENVKAEETEVAERGSKVDDLMQEINLQQIRNQLGNEQFEIESAIRALGPDSTPEEQQAIADKVTQLQALRFEYELLGATIQESMQGVALNAMDQFSAGLARVITEGDSAREMFGNLAKTIATELLTAIIRYWVGQAAAALVGQTAVAAATVAAGGAAAAAWAPAATLASIATLGGAATVGVAALGTGLTAGVGLAAAAQTGSALSAGAGRKNGGPVNSGMIYPVSEGGDPELLMQGGRSYLLPGSGGGNVVSAKDMQVSGGGGNAPIINIKNYSGGQASVESQRFSEQDKQWVIDVVVSDGNRRGKIHKMMTGTTNAVNRTS